MDSTPTAENSASVTLQNVSLAFGQRQVFQDLDCAFRTGEISVLAGPSGCGKSSLLRLVGGLLEPQRGDVQVAGQTVVGVKKQTLREIRKQVGMMFQNGALLSSMSIFENLALPLREQHELDEEGIRKKVSSQLVSVGLGDAEGLLPGQLSGGMVKRAALARALISDPEILLCDEPFSGLDPVSVRRIEELLVGLNQDRGMTILLTSHHVPSTQRMADHVVFLIDGGAVIGTPEELMEHSDERISSFWEELRSYVPGPTGRAGASPSSAAQSGVVVQGGAE
jgi:phospholipid/cholesterol/gamma-HCH transport system ATP-binding protein